MAWTRAGPGCVVRLFVQGLHEGGQWSEGRQIDMVGGTRQERGSGSMGEVMEGVTRACPCSWWSSGEGQRCRDGAGEAEGGRGGSW